MSTRNITKAYRAASDSDRAEGEGWYTSAKAYAYTLDPDNVSRAVGVIAALSPMMPWDRNRTLAAEVYLGKRTGCLSANMAKAVRILDGESPETVLSGTKVRAFYFNIMGMDAETVTIDRHAIMVAEGRRIDGKSLKFNATTNRKYADEYRRAAKILSKEFGTHLTPAMVQATVWVWWRRGYAFHYRSEAA